MLRNATIALVLVCSLSGATVAADRELEKILTDQYHNQILVLRHSFNASSQEYGFDGQPLKAGPEGPWTLYGRVMIKKVVVSPDNLRLEGNRLLYKLDKKEKRLKPFADRDRVTITIQLHTPLASADEGVALLGRVFAARPEDIASSAPPYWRSYLAKEMARASSAKNDEHQAANSQKQSPVEAETTGDAGSEKVFHVGPDVIAPKALYQPEPEFSDAARRLRFQGTLGLNVVVDNTGKVTNVQIVHPLGLGLDENAVNTVGTWRFTPATHDGQPVAVEVYVEFTFEMSER